MKCKFCFAEMDDEAKICPACGKEQLEEMPVSQEPVQPAEEVLVSEETVQPAEEVAQPQQGPAKKKSKWWKPLLAVVGMLAIVLLLTSAILYSMGYWDEVTQKIDNTVYNMKFWRENDIFYKKSYTVGDNKAERKEDAVIATLGDQKLTNGQLQAYYWMGAFNFINNYSYYLSSMGLDPMLPLDEQVVDVKTGETFQQMFLADALEEWYTYATLVDMAKEAGFTLDAETKNYLDSMETEMKKLAEESGYANIQEMIDEELFPGCSFEAYYDYNYTQAVALTYYNSLHESMLPTEDKLEEYFLQYEAKLKEQGIDKESGSYYDVRHILVAVEGGTKGEDGKVVYTDSEWEACKEKAQKLLDQYLAGETTPEAFGQLAMLYSADPGSAQNGGLYSQLTKDTSFIDNFKNWYLEGGRKPGDTGLVQNTESSVQGYHIMFFQDSVSIWETEVKNMVLTANTEKLMSEAKAARPVEFDYSKIVLGFVDLSGE